MANTVWGISNLDRHLPDGDTCPEGAVYTAYWTATLEDGGYTASSYGSIGLGEPNPDDFIPFSQLTEEQVLDWVFQTMGPDRVVQVQEELYNRIQEQINPTEASGIPW